MKTAVSIPDELFAAAEHRAHQLGLTRSALYATALTHLLAEDRRANITAELDALYADEDEDGMAFVTEAARRTLGRADA